MSNHANHQLPSDAHSDVFSPEAQKPRGIRCSGTPGLFLFRPGSACSPPTTQGTLPVSSMMTPSRSSPPPASPPPGLTPKQLAQFHRDGYLLVPDYLRKETCTALLSHTQTLLRDFSLEDHPMTRFVTGTDETGASNTKEHVGDDYFLTSGDKVRFFFEEDAFDPHTGELSKPKHQAINKIGHALHKEIPSFAAISHAGPIGARNAAIATDLGYKDPRLLQSMVICKQPEIGGAVPPHQDSTFLYTDRPSAVGFWIALEDCTQRNGCLSFAPGSHRRAPCKERFVRKADGSGTTFEAVEGERQWPRGFAHEEVGVQEEYQLGECEAGTLVLIHGNILHKSEKNTSLKSRFIYTFHVIEGEERYDEKNWLQIPGGPDEFTRLDGKTL